MKLRIQQFSGIAPKTSRQLLPENMARDARNCRLLSGELRGLHALTPLHTFAGNTKSAVRIETDGDDFWLGFASFDVDFLRGPLINDAYNRHYWAGDTNYSYFAFNTLRRIMDGDPAWRVGVPAPSAPMTIPSVTDVEPDELEEGEEAPAPVVETRAYVYTFVNQLGEESAPSAPVLMSGDREGTWHLTNISATPPDTINRCPITKRRVYRTVTGQASALFYLVTEIENMSATTYDDAKKNTTVVQNNVCQSFNWDAPPDDLKGLIAHPAGFLAGFRGREVYLSVPYRPWAWPTEYIIAVEHDIVGLAIYGNMLMVMTTSTPYYMPGTHPSNLSPQRSQSVEPCLSKRGIVATLQGVLYPSPNGLVLFNEGGAYVTTNQLISRDEWAQQFSPRTIKAAQRGMSYIAFEDASNGFIYSPAEPLGAVSTIDRFTDIDNVLTDRNSGQVYVISRNTVYEWDNPTNIPLYYTWRSKEFDSARPLNFGAAIVKMEPYAFQPPNMELVEERKVWNASRITRPLNPLGYAPLAGSRWQMTTTLGTPNFNANADLETDGFDRRRYSLGGSPLFYTGPTLDRAGRSAIMRVFADRRLVAALAVNPNKTMRLPSGFKAHYWQFEVISNIDIYSIAVAETGKELMDV